MTSDPKEYIRKAVSLILAYLHSVSGKDTAQARAAAEILEGYLKDSTLTRTELLRNIDYAMGGKGMLDRPWSDRKRLERLLDDCWWSKRFWMDPDRLN